MGNSTPAILIVLLSGPAAAGKTTTSQILASQHNGQSGLMLRHISTSSLLRRMIARGRKDRSSLEAAGAAANVATAGGWLVEAVSHVVETDDTPRRLGVVVDAVRRPEEVDAIRSRFGTVIHVHLKAPLHELAERFDSRRREDDLEADGSYETVRAHPTEKLVPTMEGLADHVIDTGLLSPAQVAARIIGLCGWEILEEL